MSSRLQGRVCVTTGTGGSMGRGSALAFAREGALVVGCDSMRTSATGSEIASRATRSPSSAGIEVR
jgi:NAD(P)-dependent dehydrogenase (short-subunit alcohol dehydrogenase family)